MKSIAILAFETSLIPSAAMIALAMTSTRLQYCRFYATLDLRFIDTSTPPLFPNLNDLGIKRLHYPDVPIER
jgi:hypothetical protein